MRNSPNDFWKQNDGKLVVVDRMTHHKPTHTHTKTNNRYRVNGKMSV